MAVEKWPARPLGSEHDPECGVCGGRLGSYLHRLSPPVCNVCDRAGRMIRGVRHLLGTKRESRRLAVDVGDVYLSIGLLMGHGGDVSDLDAASAAEAERWRADTVMVLAIAAARHWCSGKAGARDYRRLLWVAESRNSSDTIQETDWDPDWVKIDLCRLGILDALNGLPRRYRLDRRWYDLSPEEDEIERTLRRFFTRAIRVARDALAREFSGDCRYIEGVSGHTPAADDLLEKDENQESDDEAAASRQLSLPRLGPTERLVVRLKLQYPGLSLPALARSVGKSPGAFKQAWRRYKLRRRQLPR